MHRTLVVPAIIALSVAISSCGSSQPPSSSSSELSPALASQDVLPFDLNRDGLLSDEEMKAVKANPDYEVNSYSMTSNALEQGLKTQAIHSCTISNVADINARDPNTGLYYSSVNFYVTANCNYPFSSMNGRATRSNFSQGVSADAILQKSFAQNASFSAGSLPRFSGNQYALSSQLNIIFTDGQTASGSGPAAYGVAN